MNGSNNYVRMRYRRDDGVWVDNTPPGTAGPSNPSGTWFAHTPTNYISSLNELYVFLGHDAQISPGPFQYQLGGLGNNWSAVNPLDPRNQTNVTAGSPGLDGSASVRFDPLRDNNPGLIDVIYYDENDGTPGYAHHATVYYKAVDMHTQSSPVLSASPSALTFSATQGGADPNPGSVSLTNTGTGSFSYTATSDSPWLSVSPQSGSIPQNLTVATSISGLAPTTYTGHITVTADGLQGSPATITVTINVVAPVTLSYLTLNPTSVPAGASSVATVGLSRAAPPGGVVVTLSSSDASAQVPASVNVAAGSSVANFTVTSSVPTSTTATISGSLNWSVQSGNLTVNPPVLSSVTVSPTSVLGDSNATGTVTLNGKAPASGIQVGLTSSDPAAQVPANVTLAANSTTASFTVTTSTVTTDTTVVLTGAYNGTSKTASLTVTKQQPPPPAVTVSSVALNPSTVVGGGTSRGTVTLSGAAPTGGASVALSSNSGSAQVPASVLIAAGARTATFTVTTSAVPSTTTASITAQYGNARGATLTVNPPSAIVLFGDQQIEPQIDNNGRGSAEAFQVTANASGTLSLMKLYIDSTSSATQVFMGLYTDNGSGHPGQLLTQGSTTQPAKGTWNTISVPSVSVVSGMRYWIAIMGTTSGTIYFRDRHLGPCKSETSLQSTLTALPQTWNTGTVYSDCPLSAYGQ